MPEVTVKDGVLSLPPFSSLRPVSRFWACKRTGTGGWNKGRQPLSRLEKAVTRSKNRNDQLLEIFKR
ncbi:MAG TPA: hypothetical protein VKI17_06395, partial [Gemmataceae bacterium]|nr:hypothetical protein [Gemmataceae bacterium]